MRTFETTLADNETWTQQHSVAPTMTGERLRLTYLLYKGEAPPEPTVGGAYREVHLWVNVMAQSYSNLQKHLLTGLGVSPSANEIHQSSAGVSTKTSRFHYSSRFAPRR